MLVNNTFLAVIVRLAYNVHLAVFLVSVEKDRYINVGGMQTRPLSVTVSPAREKIHSRGVLVAEIAR